LLAPKLTSTVAEVTTGFKRLSDSGVSFLLDIIGLWLALFRDLVLLDPAPLLDWGLWDYFGLGIYGFLDIGLTFYLGLDILGLDDMGLWTGLPDLLPNPEL